MEHLTLAKRYDVLAVLGEGGMGTVYRVADRLNGRQELALKTIKHAGEVTAEQRLRFKEEFHAMARLRHPNTIAVSDFGQLDATSLYITMELVPGRELTEVVADGPMPLKRAYQLLIQLLQALHFIHARMYVHRDIKSQNIRVTPDDTLKLMDFGLMGQLGQQSARKVTGSPGYMAPEVALGGRIDASSDLYSVGCLAFELLTGQLPFTGSLAQVIRAHVGEPPVSPRSLRPELPERLERIVMRLLEKDQARRYRTAAEVIDDLAALAGVAVADLNLDQGRSYLTSSVLVGREREMGELETALAAAIRGETQAVMLAAPAGTGKSRLVQELLLHAKLNEVLVLHGQCVESGMAPFEALATALRGGLAHGSDQERVRFAAALHQLFPDLKKVEPPDGPPLTTEQLAEATASWLMALSERVPVVWLMDDLHWADAQTLAVFNHCIRQLEGARVLCMGTFRNDETPADSPVWHTLEEGRARALSLGPLSEEGMAALLGAMLGEHEISPGFAEALYGATGGNAFFLTEVLRSLMEDALLIRRGGSWRFPAEGDVLRDLASMEATVCRRLGHLDRPARRLAGIAAVVGRHQTLCLFQAIAGMQDQELFAALDTLVERQFLLREDDCCFSFPHDRVREVLYDGLSPGTRAALHQYVGEYLEAHPGDDPLHHVYELAHHFGRGLDPGKAYACLMAAGSHAEAAGADATAIRFWQRAEAAVREADVPERALKQARAWWAIGQQAFVLFPHEAEAALVQLVAYLDAGHTLPEIPGLFVPLGLLAMAQGFGGNAKASRRTSERARSLTTVDDPVGQALLAFQCGGAAIPCGHYDQVIALGEEVEAVLGRFEVMAMPPHVRGPMVGALTFQNWRALQGYKPLDHLRDGALERARVNNDAHPFTVHMLFGMHHLWAGRIDKTQSYLDHATQKSRRTGAAPYPFALYVRAHLFWQRGDFATALAFADQSLAYPHVRGLHLAAGLLRLVRGLALVDLGRAREAREALDAVLMQALQLETLHVAMLAQLALGYEALAREDVAAAAVPLQHAYRTAEEGPARNPLVQLQAGRMLARVAIGRGDLGRARSLAEEALAIAERPQMQLPLEEAHGHMTLARVARARGDRQAALAALGRAGDLYHRLKQTHYLHGVTRLVEEIGQITGSIAQAAPAQGGVEARWQLMRGAMI